MGKTSSQKRREKNLRKKESTKKENNKKRIINTVSIVIASIIVLGIIGAAAYVITTFVVKKVDEHKEATKLEKVVVKSDYYNLTLGDMQYLFYDNYSSFMSTKSEEVEIDESLPLSMQFYDEPKGITWFDFFLDDVKATVESYVMMASEAQSLGYSLSESEFKEIDEMIEMFEYYGAEEEEEYTKEEYIEYAYGEGITEQNVRTGQELTKLANKYYNIIMDEFALNYTDDDYNKFYEENLDEYISSTTFVDVMLCSFSPSYDETATEEYKESSRLSAYQLAEELRDAESVEAFEEIVIKYIDKLGWADEDNVTTKDYVYDHFVKSHGYETNSELGKWVFSEDRQVGDTVLIEEDEDTYVVYCMLKTCYFNETPTRNIRHILIEAEENESSSETYKRAANLLNEWKNGEATEESFAQMAKENSADMNSSENGGLYMYLLEDEMDQAEFDDWCYDENRKLGDTGIVETDYGYHIMYYCGEGILAWQAAILGGLQEEDYQEVKVRLSEKYKVLFDDEGLQEIYDE